MLFTTEMWQISRKERLGIHNHKNIISLINMIFLSSWLSLADHQTRCSINYA